MMSKDVDSLDLQSMLDPNLARKRTTQRRYRCAHVLNRRQEGVATQVPRQRNGSWLAGLSSAAPL